MSRRLLSIITAFAALCSCNLQAQEVWAGLKEPQKVLPVGNAPFQKSEIVPFREIPSRLEQVYQGSTDKVREWVLCDGWVLHSSDNERYNAIVPGTVLTTLVASGLYPNPYYGLNNLAIPDSLSKMSWRYSISFDSPTGFADENMYLTFYGINYKSSISLNGTKIGATAGAFHRAIFEVSSILREKDNLLEVTVFPLEHPGIPHEQSMSEGQGLNGGATSLDGPTFIASVGWDWMPAIRDRNIGIWQDVRLISGGYLRIENPIIATDLPLPDTSKAAIYIETPIENVSGEVINGELVATITNGDQEITVRHSYYLYPDEVKNIVLSCEEHPELIIDNPKLWWPNGYGAQNLYKLRLETFDKGAGDMDDGARSFGAGAGSLGAVEGSLGAGAGDLGTGARSLGAGAGSFGAVKGSLGAGARNSRSSEGSCDNSNRGTLSDSKSFRFGIREISYELMVDDPEGIIISDSVSLLQSDTTAGRAVRVNFNPTERIYGSTYGKREPLFDNERRVLFSKEKNIYIPTLASHNLAGIEPISQNDPVGENLVIVVNGVRIFCRGGNWGMDDAMKRSSRARLEPFFALHKDLNFNIIRNWTGESTEETFYTLADEYGMLVWNDFWMTGEDTVDPLDQNLFLINVEDVVKRFRYHPSIAVWGARNEGFAPAGLEDRFAELIANEDPARHYHGQSRFLNMGTSGPWNYFEDASYYALIRADGFNTEMGSFAIPTATTLRKFIAPEDRWPLNDVWAYHDLHFTSQNSEAFLKDVAAAGKMDLSSFTSSHRSATETALNVAGGERLDDSATETASNMAGGEKFNSSATETASNVANAMMKQFAEAS
ncbi:MAG: glycoside hydrolase family 2 TIM barrel-domain containing protein, partial [Bacteroidales bacterium]|nr:glycoside hydrolase family 2 TIM barrel-domain containing protein [Bacteroidales bacterium]